MHILIVNDDGPPSSKSPYVHSLVRSLEAAGHTVSVVLPDVQRSWIGKAHLINEVIRCIPSQVPDQSGWLLVSSTPAACVHVGLHHSPLNRGPVDLVISGPNFGFNASSLFALSSGTLGAAFEATLCRKRAIALSYNQLASPCPEALDATTRQSVRIIEALMQQWPKDDQSLLYSVNMSVSTDFSRQKIIWTGLHQNFWERMGAFKAVEACPASGDDSSPLPPSWFTV
ncbi:survival protein sure-like phosphatase/nucleotidase [Plectosphaerella cucumerina]|uniref:Survival protein sure-like phosphatase/nucleotidase n=1 Tax=Plectosphaerella cucumerina TaxID=40658 RepID=A0A8K0X2L7_9PEZI|nr:survival protein sure-like phosphatase/nucleotidase [Plectosphaerella cucumerina]